MEIAKIKIKNDYKLANIEHEIEEGTLRIPQFQREFVWEKSKVIKLLESIYNEYPIGSFFFWNAPAHYQNFYRDVAELNLPKPSKYDKVIFILDGQQRITSLYVTIKGLTLYGKNYKNICFDLDENRFVDRNSDQQRYVSVSDLLSNDSFELYEHLSSTDRKKSFQICRKRFWDYPFSAIEVREKELDEVCEIFERINQGGKRLNLFDLVSASTWSADFDLRKKVKEENVSLKVSKFGEIDNEVYVQALALIAKGSCTRPSQLKLGASDIREYWEPTIEAMRQAISYLKNNFGVVNSSFIPYMSMIVVIAYLFYKNKSRALVVCQNESVSQWFWRTAFSERYSASTLTLVTQDRKLMDKIAEKKEIKVNYPVLLDIDSLMRIRMYRKSALKNGILCLLAKNKPEHFKNNSPIAVEGDYFSDFYNPEKHHIFPKSLVLKSHSEAMIHSLPNFCFLPAELNKEISNKKPSEYFAEYARTNKNFGGALKTHLIRNDESIKTDDFTSFLASRAALLLEEIARVIGSEISRTIANNVDKAINETENGIRNLIDRKLSSRDPNYWDKYVLSDIVGEIMKRLHAYCVKNPSKNPTKFTSREKLDFCNIMDYCKIILKKENWSSFYPLFRSKTDTEKRFLSFKEYRNAVKHGKGDVASFILKEGEASVEWLSEIVENSK